MNQALPDQDVTSQRRYGPTVVNLIVYLGLAAIVGHTLHPTSPLYSHEDYWERWAVGRAKIVSQQGDHRLVFIGLPHGRGEIAVVRHTDLMFSAHFGFDKRLAHLKEVPGSEAEREILMRKISNEEKLHAVEAYYRDSIARAHGRVPKQLAWSGSWRSPGDKRIERLQRRHTYHWAYVTAEAGYYLCFLILVAWVCRGGLEHRWMWHGRLQLINLLVLLPYLLGYGFDMGEADVVYTHFMSWIEHTPYALSIPLLHSLYAMEALESVDQILPSPLYPVSDPLARAGPALGEMSRTAAWLAGVIRFVVIAELVLLARLLVHRVRHQQDQK